MNKPLINILTRTHNRPEYFRICKSSIEQQTYKNVNHIVGSDVLCTYTEYYPLTKEETPPPSIPNGHYYTPYNLYLNDLQKYVKDGWIMYLDDDDMFSYTNSLEIIVNNLTSEDDMVIWRVAITPDFIVPSHSFGRDIVACDFSGIGFVFHSKHLPVDWGNLSMGDYRVGKQLQNKGLELKWISAVLTQTINGAHGGR